MFRDSFVVRQADKRLRNFVLLPTFCPAQGDFQPREFCRITVRELWLLADRKGDYSWDAKGFVDDLRIADLLSPERQRFCPKKRNPYTKAIYKSPSIVLDEKTRSQRFSHRLLELASPEQ